MVLDPKEPWDAGNQLIARPLAPPRCLQRMNRGHKDGQFTGLPNTAVSFRVFIKTE